MVPRLDDGVPQPADPIEDRAPSSVADLSRHNPGDLPAPRGWGSMKPQRIPALPQGTTPDGLGRVE
jgi:hypothetical protein